MRYGKQTLRCCAIEVLVGEKWASEEWKRTRFTIGRVQIEVNVFLQNFSVALSAGEEKRRERGGMQASGIAFFLVYKSVRNNCNCWKASQISNVWSVNDAQNQRLRMEININKNIPEIIWLFTDQVITLFHFLIKIVFLTNIIINVLCFIMQ